MFNMTHETKLGLESFFVFKDLSLSAQRKTYPYPTIPTSRPTPAARP